MTAWEAWTAEDGMYAALFAWGKYATMGGLLCTRMEAGEGKL